MGINDPESVSIKQVSVRKINGLTGSSLPDILSVEEPLEIRISYGPAAERIQKNISVTMRTPGNDLELAIGFLFTEGIISSYRDIKETSYAGMGSSSKKNQQFPMTHIRHAIFTFTFEFLIPETT